MRLKILLILSMLSLCLAFQYASAQEVTLSNQSLEYVIGEDKLYIYCDTLRTHNIENIHTANFTPSDRDTPTFGYTKNSYWARIELKNRDTTQTWLLHYNWIFADTVEFYFKDPNDNWQMLKTGYLFPFYSRPLVYNSFVFPLDFSHAESQTFYLRISGVSPLAFSILVQEQAHLKRSQDRLDMLYGLYFGSLFVMMIYNFFIWFFLRDRSYLYYIITIFTTLAIFSTVTGYTFRFLWPNTPILSLYVAKLAMVNIIVMTILFSNQFLNMRHYAPIFIKIFRVTLVLCAVLAVYTLIDFAATRLTSSLLSIHLIMILTASIIVWRRGNKSARFFVLAWFLYIAGGIFISLANLGVIEYTGLARHGVIVGSLCEVVLLGLALSDRYQLFKKEKEDAQALALEIAQKAKDELELKVKQRTREISEKNEELITSEEEIRQQSEELQTINESLLQTQYELQKLSLVAQKATNAITITDKEGNIIWTNPSHAEITGYDATEIEGYSFPKFLRKQKATEQNIKNFIQDLQHSATVSRNLQLYNKRGEAYWVNLIVSAVKNDSELVTNYITVATDISELQYQKEVITKKHTQLTDNLKYALRIQQALLPNIKENLPEAFLINKPKDIVSGDFYWVKNVGDVQLIAVADCTGHGTSAAFVTILGISILNEVIDEYNTENLSEVFHTLDNRLCQLLKANEKDGLADGMDIALIRIDAKKKKIDFIGANQNLYIVEKGKMHNYKGNRVPIGFSRMYKEKVFDMQHIPYPEKESMVYMFSDGYPDQFGGPRNRKFMKKRFKNLLIEIANQDLETQNQILNETFQDWKAEYKQTDDVVVLGLRL
ncbi:MAG: PAS domain-containing protein [Bernardetiaceae bacterium]|nr:PAS domain-containing protein [Bernardetiaceae bacterium]